MQGRRGEGLAGDGAYRARRDQGPIDKAELQVTGPLAETCPAVEATRYQGERSANNYDSVDGKRAKMSS